MTSGGSAPIDRREAIRQLQSDWNADGPEAFVFEVLDLLPPADPPSAGTSEELDLLEGLWREKLESGVDTGVEYAR